MRQRVRKHLALWLMASPLGLSVCLGENSVEFRETALTGVQSGVQSLIDGEEGAIDGIVDSLIDGLFVVLEPDSSTAE